jgi:hypothetical protein
LKCALINEWGFKDRLKGLEDKMAKENLILTESQVQALERKKQDDLAAGD